MSTEKFPSPSLQQSLPYDETFRCVQCGYCLPVCPTYQTMKKETHSPRGRINLVKLAAEGKLTDLSQLQEPIDLCLGCRACEVACPTGVQYGAIWEGAKQTLERRKTYGKPVRWLRHWLFVQLFPHPHRLRMLGNLLWFYEKSGLRTLARKTGILKRLPFHLGEFEAVLPDLPSPAERKSAPKRLPAKGERKYKVAFFHGCVMDAVFQRINRLSIELLSLAGCEVIVVDGQTCCGALHVHAGEKELAVRLAKANIAAFEREEVDFIVNNAGGCGAMLREYDHLFADDAQWRERARRFSAKTRDISQVLAACGELPWKKEIAETVTYQRSCHLSNVQKVKDEPLHLLRQIPGVRYREMENAEFCCGSAGIYNIVHYDEAMKILDEKMANVKKTQATTIVTTNPGCLLQMKLGIEREGLSASMRAVHLVELLAEAAGLR
ncbi:(Fe-S)-binding protein [Bacillaceae bacterium]